MPRRLPFLFLLLFLTFAALLRLTDLRDQPLDFNPVRQLRSSIIARGIYYAHRTDLDPKKQEQAINFGESMPLYEPPLLETLIAYGYQLTGGENIAIPRILNTFFWLAACLVLFGIARPMASEWAVLPGLAFFLFLPFSIYASRSFQPESWMVMWVALAVYAFIQWHKTPTWKWAFLAGILGGIAALVKIMAA
ncbi:MAG TPA: glycosyltransferase family 39 protein, partial [Anaerolineales bacterium]|nr:glycosyltransferase family 39 protein [Anaerolineales bacterium]